jgi:hypothetical protein
MASSTGSSMIGNREHAQRPQPHDGGEESRLGATVGEDASGPVADREPRKDDPDQRAPDEERVAEERREHAAGRDLHPEHDPAGDEDGARDREAMTPRRRMRRVYSSYTATQGPASLPIPVR